MKITILAVGKIKETWLQQGIAEYTKRISKYSELVIDQIPDSPETIGNDRAVAEEGKKLLGRIRDTDFVVALDVSGTQIDSVRFAEQLVKWLDVGASRLTLLIAGSNGYSDEVLNRANARVSLSQMTYPHQIARLILLEQIYRAFKIYSNEKYHK